MSVTTTNRNINDLHPVAQSACKLFLQECEKAGIKIFITETYRSQARQNWLYAQGRTRPGNIVTQTLNSNHMSRLAWDIAVSPPVSLYDVATLNKAGAIAKRLGITWGGDWKGFVDRPHFEVKTNWTAPVKVASEPTGEIEDLQRLLNQVGFQVGVSGMLDKSTINATMMFQQRTGLTADGIAGKDTKAKLKEVIAKNNAAPKKEDDEKVATYEKDAQPGKSLEKEFARAVEAGITDGTYPQRQATREEVAVMVLRGMENK